MTGNGKDAKRKRKNGKFAEKKKGICGKHAYLIVEIGKVFVANGWCKPEGFCDSAWDTVSPFVMTLAHGGEDFYDGWMQNKKSAMISCNDGFRPVSFLLEAMDEDAD